jgi:hypothetical protein
MAPKKEAQLNTIFNQYLREKKLYCFYELKQDGGKGRLSLNQIEDSQWEGLPAAERNGLVWKISDESSRPKPCDGFSAPPAPAYLVIYFPRDFFMIPFGEIVKLREEGIISLTKERARGLAERIIKI